jgi:hypothetical protein
MLVPLFILLYSSSKGKNTSTCNYIMEVDATSRAANYSVNVLNKVFEGDW